MQDLASRAKAVLPAGVLVILIPHSLSDRDQIMVIAEDGREYIDYMISSAYDPWAWQ